MMLSITRSSAIATMALAIVAAAPAGSMAESADVTAENAWVRAPAIPGRNGAGFVTLHNQRDNRARLIGAETAAAERVELHRTTMEDGVMNMTPQDSITIPANATTKLEPGGYHLMLIKAGAQADNGETITLTLHFESAPSQTVRALVVGPGRSPDMSEAQ